MVGICFLPTTLLAASLPSSRDIQVDAGLSRTIEIPIENTAESSETVDLSLMSATFVDGQDQPELGALSDEMKSWVSLQKTSLDLLPHQKTSALLTVNPPVNPPNETVTIAVVATEKIEGQISLNHGSATLVFVTVGEEKAEGRCVKIAMTDSATAKITMTNAGKGMLVADGNMVLRGPFGLHIAETNLNMSHHRILSGQTRSWNVDVPALPWWAVGSFTLGIEDANIAINSCGPLSAGSRWWPMGVLAIVCFSIGGVVMVKWKRR